jgi:XTP/dITP diphosphohydrolase
MVTEKTEIVLGTRNHGKIAEFRSLLKGASVKILSFYDFQNVTPAEEDGKSFRENAMKKARVISKATGRIAISDDSGLQVDFLNGEPGVYSARFAGEKATGKENSRRILKLLDRVPWEQRTARFVCVICAADSKGKTIFTEGVCQGKIGFEMRGSHGFGYDPIFVPDGHRVTMAEMSFDQKNRISHRGDATSKFRPVLKEFLNSGNSR